MRPVQPQPKAQAGPPDQQKLNALCSVLCALELMDPSIETLRMDESKINFRKCVPIQYAILAEAVCPLRRTGDESDQLRCVFSFPLP